MAFQACRPILAFEDRTIEVSTGQMMGSYLSFPFLCLQNYLAFRWSLHCAGVKGPVPVIINGDDILFQQPTPEFHLSWRRVVGEVGLVVEETKTSVSREYGSLNSTLLRWSGDYLEPAWTARFGMFRSCDGANSLGKSFMDFLRGCPADYRFFAGREWFRWHVAELRSASVSLPSLGFRGLLAMRLAKAFDVLYFPEAELPVLKQHGVWFSNSDFVTRVPRDAVDEELALASSLEIASAKWNEGWYEGDRVSSALQYCLELTSIRNKSRVFDYPGSFDCVLCTESWMAGVYPLTRCSCPVPPLLLSRLPHHLSALKAEPWCHGLSRAAWKKRWLSPVESQDYVLVVTSLILDTDVDLGRGPLPPYSESFDSLLVEYSPGQWLCCG